MYPKHSAGIPAWSHRQGRYECRYARTDADLDAVERLRYEVFNCELGEGLAESEATARDEDGYDAQSHHLMVSHLASGEIVGTYRLLTHELVADALGFYSGSEFDLSCLPAEVLADGVELGRACVAKGHRGGRILHLLWTGIAAYLAHNEKRFLFGCASIPDDGDEAAAAASLALREGGHLHTRIAVKPQPGNHIDEAAPGLAREIPGLLRAYLGLGARVCGRPARDREFGTIDYFVLLDVQEVAAETRARFDA